MTTPDSDGESTLRGLARLLQGMVLDQLAVGVALMGLVAVAAGLLEATGVVRAGVVAVGLGVVVVTFTGWRRRWPDRAMWPAMLGCAVAALAAFVLAIT